MMSLPTRILVGLVLGLVSGIVISLSPGDTLKAIPLFIEPGAIGYFLLITIGLIGLAALVLYLLAVVIGRLPLAKFARACAPAQVVGFSTN